MEKEKYLECRANQVEIEALYRDISLFDAIGLVGRQIQDKVRQLDKDTDMARLEIAALLKVNEYAAANMLSKADLQPEQAVMLSGDFVKSLKDVKNLLLRDQTYMKDREERTHGREENE